MARYRRRYRTIVRAPKKKWASAFNHFDGDLDNTTGATAGGAKVWELTQNSVDGTNPTPVILKTGNFRIQADFYYKISDPLVAGQENTSSAMLYVIYVPEAVPFNGHDPVNAVIKAHPEWVMAWKVLDIGYGDLARQTTIDGTRIIMSSRLKRNLNSGDKIYLALVTENQPNNSKLSIRGVAQYWTCAN